MSKAKPMTAMKQMSHSTGPRRFAAGATEFMGLFYDIIPATSTRNLYVLVLMAARPVGMLAPFHAFCHHVRNGLMSSAPNSRSRVLILDQTSVIGAAGVGGYPLSRMDSLRHFL